MSYLAWVLYIIDYLTAALDKNLDYVVVILLYYFRSGVHMLFKAFLILTIVVRASLLKAES